MCLILCIETSSDICSVALSEKGKLILNKSVRDRNFHSSGLTSLIKTLFAESGFSLNQLNMVAVSKGPGSFTGLRIGVSFAKGIAFGLDIPFAGIDTLESLAYTSRDQYREVDYYCPVIDARIGELYFALYDQEMKMIKEPEAVIPAKSTIPVLLSTYKIAFPGDGAERFRSYFSSFPNAILFPDIITEAKNMIELAYTRYLHKKFDDIQFFEPYYLKDFKAKKFSETINRVLNQ